MSLLRFVGRETPDSHNVSADRLLRICSCKHATVDLGNDLICQNTCNAKLAKRMPSTPREDDPSSHRGRTSSANL